MNKHLQFANEVVRKEEEGQVLASGSDDHTLPCSHSHYCQQGLKGIRNRKGICIPSLLSINQQKVAVACLEYTFVSEETRGQRNIDGMQEKRMNRNKKNESDNEL